MKMDFTEMYRYVNDSLKRVNRIFEFLNFWMRMSYGGGDKRSETVILVGQHYY